MLLAWTRPAANHLDEIQDYIARDNPPEAFRVIDEIIARTETLLTANPLIGRSGRVKGTRELVLAPLPYIVVYRLRERVEILAVVHGARHWPRSFS